MLGELNTHRCFNLQKNMCGVQKTWLKDLYIVETHHDIVSILKVGLSEV